MTRWFCAVPARAGSERLPGKNIASLGGRPMIQHTISAALATERFDEVVVCTDSEEIADAARDAGAVVPMLVPAELAGPLVASHVPCQWVHEQLGEPADVLVCLQPTSPLRTSGDIEAGLDEFESHEDRRAVVSVTPIDPHYFHWAVRPGEDLGGWSMWFGDQFLVERPLLPPVHRPNGAVKIATFESLREHGHFFVPPFAVVDMPEDRSVHVATAFDLALCDSILRGAA